MKRRVIVCASILPAGLLLNAPTSAQDDFDRTGRIDWSFQISGVGSETISGKQGSSADIESSTGRGFNIEYNFDNHWAVGISFDDRDANYDARVTPGAGNPDLPLYQSGTFSTGATGVAATYYFTPSRFAPFVTMNIGGTWVNTNIPSGPPTTTCWNDPWWGSDCSTSVPTKAEWYLGYGAGVGLRWDLNGPFFLRAVVNEQWLDVGGSVGTPSFTHFRIDFGVRLRTDEPPTVTTPVLTASEDH